MKILLVSDTHGHDEIYEELYRIYPKMDLYLDAGDSETEQMFICPFLSVLARHHFQEITLMGPI